MGTFGGVIVERKLSISGPVDREVSPLVGYPPLGGPSARIARPPLCRYEDVTRRDNRCARCVACSL